MQNLFVQRSGGSIPRNILTILVGGVFLFIPGLTMKMVMIIIGSTLLASGLISMLLSNWRKRGAMNGFWSVQGITNVLFGILFISSPSVMVKIFVIFIGIILLIMGLLQVMGALASLSRSAWAWIIFLIGLLTTGSGLFLLSDPYKSAETILPFLGALLILNGISGLFMAWKIKKRPKTFNGSEVEDIPYEEV